MQFDNDINISDNEGVMQDEQQKIKRKKLLDNDTEDETDKGSSDNEEYGQNGEMDYEEVDQSEEDGDSSNNDDVDLLPIEKANKKLKKKQEEEQ